MMPGSQGLSPHELAHGWVKDLLTCSYRDGLWECAARNNPQASRSGAF